MAALGAEELRVILREVTWPALAVPRQTVGAAKAASSNNASVKAVKRRDAVNRCFILGFFIIFCLLDTLPVDSITLMLSLQTFSKYLSTAP